MPTQVGNFVEVEGRLIPACNIQVDGMPGYAMVENKKLWFPIYFEIMWENGNLWVVSQGEDKDSDDFETIYVIYYDGWAMTKCIYPTFARRLSTWEEFLEEYEKEPK